MTTKKIALFIDADNISAKFGKQIIETLEKHGEIFIRRIYGNWEKNSLHSWNDCILNFSLRAVQQPDYVAGKNATDMSLAIDAMDILYSGKAEIFALISNDSDFTPLAIRLREGGMKIIGMGNANAANSFRVACDEFIDFDAPAEVEIPAEPKKKVSPEKISPAQMNLFAEEKVSPAPVVANPKVISISESKIRSDRDKKIQQIHNIFREVANQYDDANGFFLLNRVRTEIKNKNLDFNIKDLGYDTLREFIAAFPKLYELKGSGTTCCLRCLTPAPKISVAKNKSEQNILHKTPEDKIKQIHKVLRDTAKTKSNENGFVDLTCAGQNIHEKKLSVKGSGHSTLSKFVSAFPNLYEVRKEGKIFSYRCKK